MNRNEIKERIDYLGDLLRRQRQRIEELEESMTLKTNKQLKALRRIIADQKKQLEAKEKEIVQLQAEIVTHKQNISQLTANVSELEEAKYNLEEQVQTQEKALTMQTDIMNEAYYVIGKRKELKELGIITTAFLGLGKSTVNTETVDLSKLEKIDVRSFANELVIPSKKVQVLSHVPELSYTIVPGKFDSKLIIKDLAKFWSLSNILVIEIK